MWDRLNGQESDGRVLVAGLAHSVALLAKGGASREARLNAVELLDVMVAATPAKLQRDLWRCFLPGLFGPLWAAAAAPPTPAESDALRCRALTACTRLVVVVCGGAVEDAVRDNAESLLMWGLISPRRGRDNWQRDDKDLGLTSKWNPHVYPAIDPELRKKLETEGKI